MVWSVLLTKGWLTAISAIPVHAEGCSFCLPHCSICVSKPIQLLLAMVFQHCIFGGESAVEGKTPALCARQRWLEQQQVIGGCHLHMGCNHWLVVITVFYSNNPTLLYVRVECFFRSWEVWGDEQIRIGSGLGLVPAWLPTSVTWPICKGVSTVIS